MFKKYLKLEIAILAAFALVTTGIGIVYAKDALDDPMPLPRPTERPTGDDWIDLLTAENASHWKNVTDDKTVFEIGEGVMHVLGKPMTQYFAWTKQDFSDFELHAEVKVTPGANSGIFIRTSPDNPVYAGMEIQVLDDHGEAPNKNGTGSLYDVASPMWNMAQPVGEWNSYDITCRGSQLIARVNGWKVIDIDLAELTEPIGKFPTPLAELPAKGHIILQDHGDEVWFRNVMVKAL